jgi:hypothetical protein
MTFRIIEPITNLADSAAMLRNLADRIDSGLYGEVHNVAWVISCGEGEIAVGMTGQAGEASAVSYYLFGLAQRKLEVLA